MHASKQMCDCNCDIHRNSVRCFNVMVVSLVAWFTLVLEANCARQPVSLLFPPVVVVSDFEIGKRGGSKETTSLLVLYNHPLILH